MFVPNIPMDMFDRGYVQQVFADGWRFMLQGFINLLLLQNPSWQLVVLSRFLDKVKRETAQPIPVQGVKYCSLCIDSQIDRLPGHRKLVRRKQTV